MVLVPSRFLCHLLRIIILASLISLECTLCLNDDNHYDENDARLIVSTIEGSLLIIRKLDGKILLNMKGGAILEGYNYMKDKYELLLDVTRGEIQLKNVANNIHDKNQNIITSIVQLATNGYDFSSDLISLNTQKDIIHFIDLNNHEIKTLVAIGTDKINNNEHYHLAIKHDESTKYNDHNIGMRNDISSYGSEPMNSIEDHPPTLQSTFALTQKSYMITVYNVVEKQMLWRLNYNSYPQLHNAEFIDDDDTYFFSIHSNKLMSLDLSEKKLNWLIHLDSHLITIGRIYNTYKFHVKRLPVKFVTERNMKEILLRLENKQNLEVFKSVEFFKNQLRDIEVLSESDGVKLYFDADHHHHQEEYNCVTNINGCIKIREDCNTMIMNNTIGCAYNDNVISSSLVPISNIDTNISMDGDNNEHCVDIQPSSNIGSLHGKLKYHIGLIMKSHFDYILNVYHYWNDFKNPVIFLLSLCTILYWGANNFMRHYIADESLNNTVDKATFVEDGPTIKITDMELDLNDKLYGFESCGFNIYGGKYQSKNAAIRVYNNMVHDNLPTILQSSQEFNHEINMFSLIPHNNHIIKMYYHQRGIKYSYIATELYTCDLAEFFKSKCPIKFICPKTKNNMIYQILKGIKHLHYNNISHGKLVPSNIVIYMEKNLKYNSYGIRVALSNFSYSQTIEFNDDLTVDYKMETNNVQNSNKTYFNESKPQLTYGRIIKSDDIFIFGLIILFITFNDEFPEDFPWNNITTQSLSLLLKHLDYTENDYYDDVFDLVDSCVCNDLTARYTTRQLIHHPYFWNLEQKSLFVSEVSNQIENIPSSNFLMKSLENASFRTIKGNWFNFVSDDIVTDICKHRSYRGGSFKDLLRVIRNKRNHFSNSTTELKNRFKTPDQLTEHLFDVFPSLIIRVYNVFKNSNYYSIPALVKFFPALNELPPKR